MPHSITLGPGSVRDWRLGAADRERNANCREHDFNSRVLHPVNAPSQKSFAWVPYQSALFLPRPAV